MNETSTSLSTGLISGAITAVVTYFAKLAKERLDLPVEYDKELRQARLNASGNHRTSQITFMGSIQHTSCKGGE